MTSPAPTIRCLSCGYDVASLIAQRGRDKPGVCPECGTDLRESNLEKAPPGMRIQHEWDLLDYLHWWWRSLVQPRSLAALASADHTGRVFRYNCRAAAFLTLLLGFAVGMCLVFDSWNSVDTILLIAIVSIVAAGAVYVASVLGSFVVAAVFRLQSLRDHERRDRNRLALDIATSWVVVWGLTIPVAAGVPIAAMNLGLDRPDFGDFWKFVAVIGVIVLVAVFLANRRVSSRPASQPPSPSNRA